MNSTLYPCPCCGFLVFNGPPGTYEFCPVCAWQETAVQLRFATFPGGPNKSNLVEAQAIYSEYGTTKRGRHPSVPSSAGFDRDENWRPIDLIIDNIEWLCCINQAHAVNGTANRRRRQEVPLRGTGNEIGNGIVLAPRSGGF